MFESFIYLYHTFCKILFMLMIILYLFRYVKIEICYLLYRKKRISTKDLALFVNAMTVSCIDPKNFFGLNIVAELRRRIQNSNRTNPFFLLALCIGGENMTTEDAQKLHHLFHTHLRSSWTGKNLIYLLRNKNTIFCTYKFNILTMA